MKLSITIILLATAFYAFAQNTNNSNSRGTKIDENEKKRLENQFKALNTFYINDDGLVVYQTQGDQTSQSQEKTPAASENVKSQESDGQYLINEESPKSKNTPTERPTNNSRNASSNETQAHATNRAGTSSGIIRKEALKPTEATTNETIVSESTETRNGTETKPIRNSSIEFYQKEELPQQAPKSAETKAKSSTASATKKPVLDKKTKPNQYKTIEEAALAVEALLEDLRKEQSQTTSAGSMSSRLSGGAGRSTLRKKPITNPYYNSGNSEGSAIPNKSRNLVEEEISPFGTEPTYYINGKEVDKIEVNRLRKKEIISKEIRTRNTVSGNPNGEVWYEVKYDN